MTDKIRAAAGPAAPTPKVAAPKAAPQEAPVKMANDDFFRTPPTPAQIADAKKAIAELDSLPKEPLGREAKRGWIAEVTPKLDAAKKALDLLQDGQFFHKVVAEADVDAARDKVYGLERKVDDAKEAAGLVAPTKPASPFRPLNQATAWATDMMRSNAFFAVIGVIALVPCMLVDLIDTVTRPLQAIAYPFFWGQYKLREAQFDPKDAAAATESTK